MEQQKFYGYNGKILFIDLSFQTYKFEEREENFWRKYVGGGLASTFLLCEGTEPEIDPLSQDNLLIISSSVVAGQPRTKPCEIYNLCKKSSYRWYWRNTY